MISLLTELGIFLIPIFYNYASPDGLGNSCQFVKFVSKKTPRLCKFRRRKDSFLAKPKGAWWETGLRPCA